MPKRIPSPHVATARPLVEPQVQPLYDCEPWSPTTDEATFFANALGSLSSAGAFNVRKTLRHTNMEVQGQLSQPKLFVVRGIRIGLNNAPQTTSSEALNASSESFGHFQGALQRFLQYRTYFTLRIGVKDYARGPTFLYPMNNAIQPKVASAAIGQRFATGSVGAVTDAFYSQTWGLYYSTGRNAITIPPGQHVRGTLRAAAGTLSAVDAIFATGENDGIHRLVYLLLDGVFAKEVM